ncbi:hypothetical protein OC845_001202 [Tilletia horrida]|nr:hypothetical protein OC845_001202 [Tilletia horrida]
MPRPSPPLLSFSQTVYILITLFQAYTYLGLTVLRVRDALPERPRALAGINWRRLTNSNNPRAGRSSASSSASSSSRGADTSSLYLKQGDELGLNAAAILAASAGLSQNDQRQLQHLLSQVQDQADYDLLLSHVSAVQSYHTFLNFQRTAGLQPSLTARLPVELVRKIFIHAGVPTRPATRSAFELASSPVAILSLNRAIHAALIPRIYHSLVLDRPPLFRSIRITLSQHPAASSSTIQLPQPGHHIRTLHIGSALFGTASSFASLLNGDDDEDEDGNVNADNSRRSISRSRHGGGNDDEDADSDAEGYLPTHLASPSVLSLGIEQILLAAPHLHTLSLDLYALSALYTGHPRRFASPRAPRPKILRCELAIPQSLTLKLFREVQSVELLCFGMDPSSALELCATLPRGCTELTLRFVRRRRLYGSGATGSNPLGSAAASGGVAARARDATRSLFGLGGPSSSSAAQTSPANASRRARSISTSASSIFEDDAEDEEYEDDDFHSAHETEEAVRNLAAAVRVLQFSGRSPSLFSQASPSSHALSSSPSSHHSSGLPGGAMGSPFSTPRAALMTLSNTPSGANSRSPVSALASLPMIDASTPPSFASALQPAPRVSEFFHPDAVPPPNSIVRLHSMESSISSLETTTEDDEDEDQRQLPTSPAVDSPEAEAAAAGGSGGMLGLTVGEERRDSFAADGHDAEERHGPGPSASRPIPIPQPAASRSGRGTTERISAHLPASTSFTSPLSASKLSNSTSPRNGGAVLPPELTLSQIRVLAWPAALRRLRQILPDAERIVDEPSGRFIVPRPNANFVMGTSKSGKGKAKREEEEFSSSSSLSAAAAGYAGGRTFSSFSAASLPGMPVLGPEPATIGLGLDSVHARGLRRGVQELWSTWARQEADGRAV